MNTTSFKYDWAFLFTPFTQTRLTIYEATGSDGDLLIFPDMLKYKQVFFFPIYLFT